jgi:hypothetical protein
VNVLWHFNGAVHEVFAFVPILEQFGFDEVSPFSLDEQCAALPRVRRREVSSTRYRAPLRPCRSSRGSSPFPNGCDFSGGAQVPPFLLRSQQALCGPTNQWIPIAQGLASRHSK